MLPLLFFNCKKEDPILFEMGYSQDFTIPAGLNPVDAHYFRITDIPVGTYLSSRGLTADMVNSIRGRQATFINIFAGTSPYSFLREVSIRIYTDNENISGEPFWHFNVPTNAGDNLGIPQTDDDIKEYLTGSTFNLLIKLDLRASPLQNVETRLNFTFGVR